MDDQKYCRKVLYVWGDNTGRHILYSEHMAYELKNVTQFIVVKTKQILNIYPYLLQNSNFVFTIPTLSLSIRIQVHFEKLVSLLQD